MSDVFISYSSEDRNFALRLADDVGNAGHSVWIDCRQITGREPYWDEIQEAIESCSQFLFLISPESISKDRNVWKELYHADNLKPRPKIVPIMVRDTARTLLPILISPGIYQIQDAVNRPYDVNLQSVLFALSMKDTQREQQPQTVRQSPNSSDYVDLNSLYAEFYKVRNEYIQFSRSGKTDGDEHVHIISMAQMICLRASGMTVKCPTGCRSFDTSPGGDLSAAQDFHEQCKDYFDYIAEKWLTPNQVTRQHNALEADLWGEYRERNEAALDHAKSLFEKSLQQLLPERKAESMTFSVDDMTTYMQDLVERLKEMNPIDPYKDTVLDQLEVSFMQALKDSEALVVDFARLCSILISSGNSRQLRELYDSFGEISTCYHPYKGFSGSYSELGFDFFRFIGYELFVVLISFLTRHECWMTIDRLLSRPIYVRNTAQYTSDMLHFSHVSQPVRIFDIINTTRSPKRLSLHADVLNERYSFGDLKRLVSIEQFIEADYFLFLRKEEDWLPRSWWYIRYSPKYLVKAKITAYAERLLLPFKLDSIPELRERVRERNAELRQMGMQVAGGPFFRSALEDFNVSMIGSL